MVAKVVFGVDAILILVMTPWFWITALAFCSLAAGWFLSYLYMKQLENDARTLWTRFARLSDAEKSHVENILRIAETRIFGRR